MYYTNDTTLFLDGKFVKAADAKTDLFSQTLHYGYGVFEGIRAYQTVMISFEQLPYEIYFFKLKLILVYQPTVQRYKF